MSPALWGAIRTILAAIGGLGVAKGFFGNEELEQALTAIESLVGAVLVLVTLYWSWKAKQASSGEAKKVAEKVISNPNPED